MRRLRGPSRAHPRSPGPHPPPPSGGHVLTLAAKLGPSQLKAVVANEPFLKAPSPFEDHHFPDPARSLRLLAACLSDRLRAALGLPPVYVRLAAPMSEKAVALVPLQDADLPHFKLAGSGARHFQGVRARARPRARARARCLRARVVRPGAVPPPGPRATRRCYRAAPLGPGGGKRRLASMPRTSLTCFPCRCPQGWKNKVLARMVRWQA
jgi:hypothetical protein